MNALAVYYVNQHLQDLRDEAAAARRVYKVDRPSLRERIATAASDARLRLSIPLDNRGTIVPRLGDHPYRS